MSDISLSGMMVFLILLALVVLVVGIIYYFRSNLGANTPESLGEKYADHSWESPLTARSKYPDVNAFSLSRPIFLFGLFAALATTLLAFSWTDYEEKLDLDVEALLEMDEEIEIEPPRTKEPPPPPPPPPPPVIEEVPEEEI